MKVYCTVVLDLGMESLTYLWRICDSLHIFDRLWKIFQEQVEDLVILFKVNQAKMCTDMRLITEFVNICINMMVDANTVFVMIQMK